MKSPGIWSRSKGPGQGLSPQRYTELIGRVVERIIEADDPFLERDLGQEITLNLEQTLPMPWGFVVRFNDFRKILDYKSPLLEFHFTDKDLDDNYPGDDLDMQLIVHAPEFWGNHLVDLCTFDESQRLASVALLQRSDPS